MSDVSCRMLIMTKQMLEEAGYDWAAIIPTPEYPASHCLNPKKTLPWKAYAEMIDRCEAAVGGLEQVKVLSRGWGVGKQLLPVHRFCRACFNAESFYRTLVSMTMANQFRGIFFHSVTREEEGVLRIELRLREGLRGSLGFMVSAIGVFEGYPNLLGYSRATVEILHLEPTSAVYRVTPPPFRNLWNRFRAWVETPFRMRDSVLTIATQDQALWENRRELHRRKDDLEAILNASVDAIALAANGVVVYANPALLTLLRAEHVSEVLGQSGDRWLDESTALSLALWRQESAPSQERREIRLQPLRGPATVVEISPPRVVRWENRDATLWMMRDVGERRRIENAATEASEREQRRIADDLHDGLGQEMTAIALQLEVLRHRLEKTGNPEHEPLGKLVDQVTAATRHARDISHGLSPRIVIERGLVPALQWLARHTSEVFGMRIQVDNRVSEDQLQYLGAEAALVIYRAAQECFSNARRHGRATEATLRLSLLPSRLVVDLEDNGTGMPEPLPESAGMGLKILWHRLHRVGGRAELGVRHDGASGTRVSLFLPLLRAGSAQEPVFTETLPTAPCMPGFVAATAKPLDVWLVDDHAVVRDGLARILEQQGHFRVAAQVGSLAELRQCQAPAPDLIVLDHFLGNETGLEALPELRARFPRTRLALFSMGAEELYAPAALQAGADLYLSKQMPPEEVVRRLREVAGKAARTS